MNDIPVVGTVTITGIYRIDILPKRKQYHIPARLLASRAGITWRCLFDIEHEKATPRISTYMNLIKALDQLVAEKQQQNDNPAA